MPSINSAQANARASSQRGDALAFADEGLHQQAIAAAKSKFKIWPSAYASGWMTRHYRQLYKAKKGRSGGAFKGRSDSLKEWFAEDWKAINSSGKIIGGCGDGETKGKVKCLPSSKARSLSKKDRSTLAKRKQKQDPNPNREGAPVMVSSKKREDSMTPEVFAQAILSIEQNYGLRLDARSVWLRMDDWKRLGRDQMGQNCGRGWYGLRGACKRGKKGADNSAAIKASKVALADKIRKKKGLRDRNAPKFDPKSLFTKELVDKVTNDYRHSFRSPRTIAEWEKRSFEGFVDNIEELLKSSPIKPESVDKDVETAAREYMRQRQRVFGSRANSYSSFITGKSKFNAKQAGRRSSTLDRAEEGFSAWDKKYKQGIKDRYGLTAAKEEAERTQQANSEKAKSILKERDKKVKAIVAKLPIANKSKGAHAITSADWASTGKDYKSIRLSEDGESRERWMMLPLSAGGGSGRVFLSDKKEDRSP